MKTNKTLEIIGWREFVGLPEFGVEAIKVKVDTGARTSSIHVSEVRTYIRKGKEYAHFVIHPKQRSAFPAIETKAEIVEHRKVTSSNGHASVRPVIMATITIGAVEKEIELTLVNRDMMGFRMLLGREAIKGGFLVDPGKSFLLSKEIHVKEIKKKEIKDKKMIKKQDTKRSAR